MSVPERSNEWDVRCVGALRYTLMERIGKSWVDRGEFDDEYRAHRVAELLRKYRLFPERLVVCSTCGGTGDVTPEPGAPFVACPDCSNDRGWWVISGRALASMLERVAAGDDPQIVYVEEYANSTHERPS